MKKGQRFKHQFMEGYKGEPFQNETGISLTVPDQNLTVRDLMERHTRGVGIGVSEKQEYYEDDIGGEVPNITDYTDVQERREQLKEREKQIKDEIGKQVLEKQRKEVERLRKQKESEKDEQDQKESETD